MRISVPTSAFVAAIVGFGSTLALIIAAADAFGATQVQTASWVTAICLAKAIETAILSWRYKMPVITAWSTSGAAVLATSIGYSMHDAVGAFLISSALIIVTGLAKPALRMISTIPASVSSGMLAGVLIPFVLAAARTMQSEPLYVLPLIAAFLLIRVFSPSLSVLAVLAGGTVLAVLYGRVADLPPPEFSTLTFIVPQFSLQATVGLAIPLYLVTMASQNLPGIAVLQADGYFPPSGPILRVTGLFSFLSALFGAHTTNLAAITAAICTGPEAHPDPARRWLTGPYYALAYLIFSLFGASLVALFAVLPATLVALVAGLALMTPLANALAISLGDRTQHAAAIAAFGVTASSITILGIGSAFWGLCAGLAVLMTAHLRRQD